MQHWCNMVAKESGLECSCMNNDDVTILVSWFRRLQLWATGDWQLHQTPTHASCFMQNFFFKTSNHPGDSDSLQPRFGALWLQAYTKTIFTFEQLEISDCEGDSGNIMGQLMVIGRIVWGPKVPTLKGTEVSLSVYNVSCIFFNKCLFFILPGWIPSRQSSYKTYLSLISYIIRNW